MFSRLPASGIIAPASEVHVSTTIISISKRRKRDREKKMKAKSYNNNAFWLTQPVNIFNGKWIRIKWIDLKHINVTRHRKHSRGNSILVNANIGCIQTKYLFRAIKMIIIKRERERKNIDKWWQALMCVRYTLIMDFNCGISCVYQSDDKKFNHSSSFHTQFSSFSSSNAFDVLLECI